MVLWVEFIMSGSTSNLFPYIINPMEEYRQLYWEPCRSYHKTTFHGTLFKTTMEGNNYTWKEKIAPTGYNNKQNPYEFSNLLK